jgi:hypothetical protein
MVKETMFLDLQLSLHSERYILSFGCFPGVWIVFADISEHSVCSIFIDSVSKKKEQSVPKCRQIKYKRRGITQKKEHNETVCVF